MMRFKSLQNLMRSHMTMAQQQQQRAANTSARSGSLTVDRYVLGAVIPYVLLGLLLLTTILLAQQANRFAELLLVTRLPAGMTTQLLISLIPTAITFATPTAILAGVLIGMSKMGGDSEIIAMRAAGIGNWNIERAPLLIGLVGTLGMLYVGMSAGPEAAGTLRRIGLQVALYKLDSPVEPRSFNTDLPGRTIYVREGDQASGQWGKVFIYSKENDSTASLITARSGRIDSTVEQSELVLTDAVRTTLTSGTAEKPNSTVTERLAQSRVRLPTARAAILQKLKQPGGSDPDEMSGLQLWASAKNPRESREQLEARITIHRRLSLAAAPVVFAFLGVTLGLRIRRGGRATGMIASLFVLTIYYLMSLGGEQLSRARIIAPEIGLWIATLTTILVSLLITRRGRATQRIFFKESILLRHRAALPKAAAVGNWLLKTHTSIDTTPSIHTKKKGGAGRLSFNLVSLLDRGIITSLFFNFSFAFLAFVLIFLVFTAFELSKFASSAGVGFSLIGKYLFYLLPLTAVSLAPTSTLVAVLATYALLARRHEALAWWASGQSVFRLALPAVVFAGTLGAGVWFVQEKLMPEANQKQDALRSQIRSGVYRTSSPLGQQWLASADGRRLYAFEYDEARAALIRPMIFEFDPDGVHLVRVIDAQEASWTSGSNSSNSSNSSRSGDLEIKRATELNVARGEVKRNIELLVLKNVEPATVFKPTLNKPSQLSKIELSNYIKLLKQRGAAPPELLVALAKKQTEPYNPLIMTLLAIPFAIAFGRKSAVAALATAVAIGLIFWGASSGIQQLGSYGLLPPGVAAWSPSIIFTTLGIYFLSKSKT